MKETFKKILITILTIEAQIALKIHKPKIISITGNVGKTSTKDAVYAVMETKFNTRKSQKSLNSEIGLPLTILGLDNKWSSFSGWIKNIWQGIFIAFLGNKKDGEQKRYFPEWLVLEVGADHPGDIEKISKWLMSNIVILTKMSETPVHLEFFDSPEDVLREKMFLVDSLIDGGTLVFNADDPIFSKAVSEIGETNILNNKIKKVSYGESKNSDIRILETDIIYGTETLSIPKGQTVTIENKKINLLGTLGKHSVYPIASAFAIAKILEIEDSTVTAFWNFKTPAGRMKLITGKSSSLIIDDSYNSSPIACIEAIKTLGGLSIRGRKIAVLGDMKELGEISNEAHFNIGRLCADNVHTLIIVGELAENFAKGAIDNGLSPERIIRCVNSVEAGIMLADFVRAGDVVLVKGSQSMRMERAVLEIMEDRHKADDLLVRQESEWTVR